MAKHGELDSTTRRSYRATHKKALRFAKRHPRRNCVAEWDDESAYHRYVQFQNDLSNMKRENGGGQQTPLAKRASKFDVHMRTTPSAAATPSTPSAPRQWLPHTSLLQTVPFTATNDLARSRSDDAQETRQSQPIYTNLLANKQPSKRTVINVLAYWLSLCCEAETRRQRRTKPMSIAIQSLGSERPYFCATFVPPYLRDAMFLRARLHNMCWQCGAEAHDYIGALAIVERIGAQDSPGQLQAYLRAFVNALGTTAVYRYMQKCKVWQSMEHRYAVTMHAPCKTSADILRRLQIMSEPPAAL